MVVCPWFGGLGIGVQCFLVSDEVLVCCSAEWWRTLLFGVPGDDLGEGFCRLVVSWLGFAQSRAPPGVWIFRTGGVVCDGHGPALLW